MAKVKTAKEKITAFLKANNYDASAIKDAFDELDAADVDLDNFAGQLNQYKTTNEQWASFWNETATPALTTLTQERDALKGQMEKLKAAGVQIGDVTPPIVPKPEGGAQYITAEQMQKFQSDIASASSAVMKALTKVSMKHYRTFNEEPDLDALEKLMAEGKARDVDDAYRVWSEPLYTKRRDEDTQKKIDDGIKKGVQDAISKQGITVRKRKDADIQPESFDDIAANREKKGPSQNELREAFMADLNSETTH